MDRKNELDLPEILSFEWDEGNFNKIRETHIVEPLECEQVFHNNPTYFYDEKHSQKEDRYAAYGVTDQGRKLFIVFTIRNNKMRIISARNQNKKERRAYEKTKDNTQI